MTAFARGIAPEWLNVSRETLAKLDAMLSLVEKWNPAINLVAKTSLIDGWQRHTLDSAQLFALIPAHATKLVDFGSGAGFPGLTLAILAQAALTDLRVTLVESDKRKATFLMQAARQLGVSVSVLTERGESLPALSAEVMTARAMGPLTALCGLAARHMAVQGIAIFPKGARADQELIDAATSWRFEVQRVQSQTDPTGRILILKNIHHA